MTELADLNSSPDIIAKWRGEAVTTLPRDLYIPPDALEVFLEAFQGPLDLLLYLIRKHNMDILDIPIVPITEQYMAYVEVMKDYQLELAAEYLVMAAMLAEIKSRMLLPRPNETEEDEEDPRSELVRRLQEYERFKGVAQELDALPQEGVDVFQATAKPPEFSALRPDPEVSLSEILLAFRDVMQRAVLYARHAVEAEVLSVRDRMVIIVNRLQEERTIEFSMLFTVTEGRQGAVVTLISILELVRESVIEVTQADSFSPIYVRAAVVAPVSIE